MLSYGSLKWQLLVAISVFFSCQTLLLITWQMKWLSPLLSPENDLSKHSLRHEPATVEAGVLDDDDNNPNISFLNSQPFELIKRAADADSAIGHSLISVKSCPKSYFDEVAKLDLGECSLMSEKKDRCVNEGGDSLYACCCDVPALAQDEQRSGARSTA